MVIICLQYRLLKIADYGLARDNDDCLKSKGHGWKFARSIIVFFLHKISIGFFSFEFPRLVLKMPQKVHFYTREDVLGPNNDLKRPFGGEAQICAKEKK